MWPASSAVTSASWSTSWLRDVLIRIARGRIRDAQEGLGEAHQCDPFLARQRELAHEGINAAGAGPFGAYRSDQTGRIGAYALPSRGALLGQRHETVDARRLGLAVMVLHDRAQRGAGLECQIEVHGRARARSGRGKHVHGSALRGSPRGGVPGQSVRARAS